MLVPVLGISQIPKVDSLILKINAGVGIGKYDPMIALAKVYSETDDYKASLKAQEALKIAYQFGDSTRIVNASRIIAQLYNRMAKPKEAEEILVRTMPIAKRNNLANEYKTMLNNLAVVYTIQARYDRALDINFETLLLQEKGKDKSGMSISLNNIGMVYFKLKNYNRALDFYHSALKLKTEENDSYFMDRLLVNMGLCYNQLKKFSKAREYFNRAFEVCGDNCTELIQVEGHFGLGVSYFETGNLDEALKYFDLSHTRALRINNERFQAENLIYLARIFIIKKDNEAALKALNEAERLCNKSSYNQILIETYKEFSNLYNRSNDFQHAASYQSKYINLKDSIYSEALIENIAKVQSNYEERENKAIIATNETTINRQRNLNIAIAVIALLCILLVFVLYHSNKQKKRVNQALSDAKNFIERKNQELDKKVAEKTADLEVANESLSKVNEELDNFIYKTSHDIRGPLASLKGICNVALLDVKDVVALDYLNKLDLTAERLNSILTRLLIINQINNSSMKPEAVNFTVIIDEIIRVQRKRGMPMTISVRKNIQPDLKYHADREFIKIILENLIDNAIKFHNNSTRVEPFVDIFVTQEDHELRIRVIDNGIGISEAKPDKIFQMFSRASERSSTGGIGLYITKTATEKLGGRVGLKTTPEGFTEFFVRFPIMPPRMA
jgi:signal transduction histidine kinase